MKNKYIAFSQLIKQLNQRAARAVVSQLGLKNRRLAEHLRHIFEQAPGKNYSFLADPVFEATFGWKTASEKMSQLVGKLFEPELINALDNPPFDLKFEHDSFPYLHQLQSWETLLREDWQSILVSSGTASGKTECFLIPILQDLVQQWKRINRPLIGVQALFLYPLNALINSQRQRLRAWTAAFQGNIRFCLYNGETPEYIQSVKQKESPQQVLSRTLLRNEPPPILVTNATMLEYMLVRNIDQPILKASQGKLRWIVLDEAHTYTGSQAAELTLLLRRVMHAFNVEPENVRFIATSATIGNSSEESNQKLRRFMSEIAGVSESKIAVIHGQRYIPDLPDGLTNNKNILSELEQSSKIDESELFSMLSKNETTRSLRSSLAKKAQKLSNLTAMLQKQWTGMTDEKTVNLLEYCTHAFDKKDQPFLPLRLHLFEKTLAGLWACCNPGCTGKKETLLDSPEWKFGKIFTDRREFCDDCQSPVYELITCHQCGTEYLIAEESSSEDGKYYLLPRKFNVDIDEFQLDLDDQEENEILDEDETPVYSSGFPRLVAPMPTERIDILNPETREITVTGSGIQINLIPPEPGTRKLHCVACDTIEHKEGKVFRFARLGAPFFLGDILPTLLEFTPSHDDENQKKPFDGRRLLSFTDSRQGSARIAARLQQDADRNYVRSLLYHHLAQNSREMQNTESLENIQNQIQTLEKLVKDHSNLEGTLLSLRAQAEQLKQPQVIILSWAEAREKLLNSKEVREWMVAELRRLTGKTLSLDNFADYCLYREFAHRPKRANSAETLGLISLRYPKVERLNKCPDIWKQCGGDIDDWKNLLKLILDYHVRGNTAVTIHHDYVFWMGAKIYPRFIQGPDFSVKPDNRTVLWPSCKTKTKVSRFIKLLSMGLNLDPDKKADRDILNTIFREAWRDLSGLFESFDNGYQLPLNREVEFISPAKTWICPYTQRLLDTTFKGISPYTPNTCNSAERCIEITMPRLPFAFWRCAHQSCFC